MSLLKALWIMWFERQPMCDKCIILAAEDVYYPSIKLIHHYTHKEQPNA